MEKNNSQEYYYVKSKNFAISLNFLGFKYYKFNNEDGTVSYCFKNTDSLQRALDKMIKLKKEFRYNE